MACNCKPAVTTPIPAPSDPIPSRILIVCACGLSRCLPEGLGLGEEFFLVPCPKCGYALHGRLEGDGVREILS